MSEKQDPQPLATLAALVLGCLALLTDPQLELAAAAADPQSRPMGPPRQVPSSRPMPHQPPRPVVKPLLKPPRPSSPTGAVVFVPAIKPQLPPATRRRGPYVDLEGLVLFDLHVQPNLVFATDTRYDNSSTRERAQRDELDWLAMRQHGESRGQDPISKALNVKTPVNPGENDPGFGVATAARHLLQDPPRPVPTPPIGPLPVKRRTPPPKLAQR